MRVAKPMALGLLCFLAASTTASLPASAQDTVLASAGASAPGTSAATAAPSGQSVASNATIEIPSSGLTLPSDPPEAAPSRPEASSGTPVTVPTPQLAMPSQAPAVPQASAAVPAADQAVAVAIKEQLATPPKSEKGDEKGQYAAMASFYEARAFAPLWIDGQSLNRRAQAVMAEIRRADDWGLEAASFTLPGSAALGSTQDAADAELLLTRAALRYASHARGGRMDPTDLSYNIDRQPPLLDPKTVLDALAANGQTDAYLRGLHPRHPQFERLRQAYLAARAGKLPSEPEPQDSGTPAKGKKSAAAPKPERNPAERLLINMEMWRWMPEDLGRTHILVNIPEFMFRVVSDGKVVHSERVITGKANTQTPVFSDEMEHLIINPFWGVPDSIKVKELLPGLARGSTAGLAKAGLRIQHRGRDIDPLSVDWRTTDIRNFHVYQPPGAGNALGVVKFMFPNKHHVYMHDTPTKSLFNASTRTFSHGCVRVRDPKRFAEVLLGLSSGWSKERVQSAFASSPQNNQINFTQAIPVHIAYFTATVDDAGTPVFRPDYYGYEKLVRMGLDGKAHLIVKRKDNLDAARADVVGQLSDLAPKAPTSRAWVRSVFDPNN